jgi:hypothetical protein
MGHALGEALVVKECCFELADLPVKQVVGLADETVSGERVSREVL